MSIEVILFMVVGAVALASAVMMVVTRNAVHSALWLILNFACVAFLYLLLDAPFLALVQIAVYAGAIMVLFLFVIMLLGAERTFREARQFKWLAPITLIMSMSFFIALFFALDRGGIDDQPVPPAAPMARVINTTPDFRSADFYLNDELFVAGVPFGGAVDGYRAPFREIPPGTHTLSVAQAGSETRPLPLGSFTIEPDQAVTLLSYGAIGSGVNPTLLPVMEEIDFYTDRGRGRTIIVNAFDGSPVAVVDAGSNRLLAAGEGSSAPVIVANLGLGEATEMTMERAGRQNWVFVATDADGNPTDNIIGRSSDPLQVQQGANNLFILARDRDGDLVTPVVVPVNTRTLPQFGGAEAIGSVLFTDFVLPFQLVAVLLLAAMVGAIVLTQRADIKPKPGRPTRRKVSRPLTSVIASQTGQAVTVADEPEPEVEAPQTSAGD